MKVIKKFKNSLMAGLLTFVILVIAFGLKGLYPFGDKQIMIIDSWHQYYPILQQLQYKLQHGESLFYSFKTGMGTNFLLMMTYYAMSPLNLLSILVPSEYMREFMAYITLFKIAFAAGSFTYYLERIYKKEDLSVVIFGVSFAFSGFFMAYYWNLMWLDVVAVMPLTILGLHNIINKKSYLLYIITLAYALISNYYAAYFLCLFIFFYSFVLLYLQDSKLKTKFFSLLSIAWNSLLAILLACISLAPVFEGMKYAYALASKNPDKLKLYQPILDVLTRLTPYAKPENLDGLPNISISALALILIVFYFTSSKIDFKAKLANASLIVFLLLATVVNYLDFFWHAFHFPNQVPHRFVFVLIFLIFTLAYEAFINYQNDKKMLKISFIIVAILIASQKVYTDDYYQKVALAAMLTVLVYAVALYFYHHKPERRKIVSIIILVLVVIESLLTGYFGIQRTSTRSTYPENNTDMREAIEYAEQNDNKFGRIEVSKTYTANDPLLYRYNGITQFSSTANAGFNAYARSLGLSASPGSNSYRYFPNTPIANGFLNLDYIIDKEALPFSDELYQTLKIFGKEEIRLLKNKYPFTFGFAVEDSIYGYNPKKSDPFHNQEKLIQLSTGLDIPIFSRLSEDKINVELKNIKDLDIKNLAYNYKNINKSKTGSATLTIDFPKDGLVYAYVKNSHKKVKVKYNDLNKTYDPRKGVVIDLGQVKAGEQAEIKVYLKAQKSGYFDFDLVYFDEKTFKQYYEILKTIPFEVENISDTKINGTINLPMDKVLYLALPLDDGWHLKVDGENQELSGIEEGITLIDLSAGEHQISLEYIPVGLIKGMILFVVGLLLLILTPWLKKQSTKFIKDKTPAKPVETAEQS